MFSLPTRPSPLSPTERLLHPSLVAPDTRVLGLVLEHMWGNRKEDGRVKISCYRARTLTISLAQARADVAGAVAVLRGVVAAREARLARREATITEAEEG
jgi:hypothetical protein